MKSKSISIIAILCFLLFLPFLSVNAGYCNTPRGPESAWTEFTCNGAGHEWVDDGLYTCIVGGQVYPNVSIQDCNTLRNEATKQEAENASLPATGSQNCVVNGEMYEDVSMTECNTLKQAALNQAAAQSGDQGYFKRSKNETIGSYIRNIYTYAIGIVGIIATVVIMVAGLVWISSMGNAQRVSQAREWVVSALMGLALALLSYSILYFINPDLVNFKSLDVDTVSAPKASSGGTGSTGTGKTADPSKVPDGDTYQQSCGGPNAQCCSGGTCNSPALIAVNAGGICQCQVK